MAKKSKQEDKAEVVETEVKPAEEAVAEVAVETPAETPVIEEQPTVVEVKAPTVEVKKRKETYIQ